jgi:hypothetical protein
VPEHFPVDLVPDPVRWLQSEADFSLAAWYASPLTQMQATALQTDARLRLQQAMTGRMSSLVPRLADVIAGFWLGRDVSLDYRSLMATLPEMQRATVELVYGQLLMSCKRSAAMLHLERGFELATAVLAPAAYFVLLRRHTLLSYLVLTPTGAPPQTLGDLMQEARVIQRLSAGRGVRGGSNNPHDDTLG